LSFSKIKLALVPLGGSIDALKSGKLGLADAASLCMDCRDLRDLLKVSKSKIAIEIAWTLGLGGASECTAKSSVSAIRG